MLLAGRVAATKAPVPICYGCAPGALLLGWGGFSAASAPAPIVIKEMESGGLDSVTFRIDGAGFPVRAIVEKRVKALKA